MSSKDSNGSTSTATDGIVWNLSGIAKVLGVSDDYTIQKWIQKERLPASKLGGRWVSHTDSITAWIKARAEGRAV